MALIVVLFGLQSFLFSAAAAPSRQTPIPSDCSLELPGERIGRASPVAADLDKDGRKEVIVAANDGMVYAVRFTANCSGSTGSSIVWQTQVATYINAMPGVKPTAQSIQSSPTVADFDGDGYPEIIVATGWMPQEHLNGAMLVLDHNGKLLPGWPKLSRDLHGAGDPPWNPDGYPDGFYSSPAVGDIDGDGEPEIVVGGFDKCIYAWEGDGTPVSGWWNSSSNQPARCLIDTIWSSPALADIAGDEALEIIIGTDAHPEYTGGSIWALTGDNRVLWTKYTTEIISSSPAVGDLDGDGELEIVVGTGTYYSGPGGHKIYALDRSGNDLPGWPVATSGDMPSSPALGDLDGNGDLEIAIGCGTEPEFANANACAGNHLYVLHHDGRPFAGFPRSVPVAVPWEPRGAGPVPFGPLLGDYDRDGKIDIFTVVAGAWGVTVLPTDQPDSPRLFTPAGSADSLHSTPILTNLTEGGELNMIIASALNGKGGLYLWRFDNVSARSMPWPMFRRDARRTGRMPEVPTLAVSPESLLLLHSEQDSGNATTTLVIENKGGGSFTWSASAPSGVTLSATSGTVSTSQVVQVTISTGGRNSGSYNLGNIEIQASHAGDSLEGSPVRVPVRLIIGEIEKLHVPIIRR